jgi:hypothetical protein
LANDASFAIVDEKYAGQELDFTFVFQEMKFRIESDRFYLQLYVSPIRYAESECDLGNLVEYANNVIENKPRKIRPVSTFPVRESYEAQIRKLAHLVKENLPQIKAFCVEENYLKNCAGLRNYMLEVYPQFFKGLRPF